MRVQLEEMADSSAIVPMESKVWSQEGLDVLDGFSSIPFSNAGDELQGLFNEISGDPNLKKRKYQQDKHTCHDHTLK